MDNPGRFLSVFAGLALVSLPTTARADDAPEEPVPEVSPPEPPPAPKPEARPIARESTGDVISLSSGSMRGVAEEFLVLPDGADVGGRLRTITSEGGLGPGKLAVTDLALFDANVQWAFAPHYELDATVTAMPKQPSMTHEHIFQGASLAVRRDVAHQTAIAVSASAAPLAGLHGEAFGGAAFLTHKHRLNEIVTFSLAGGASSTVLHPAGATALPYLIEAAAHASVLCRIPNGVWGGWLGVSYAVPAYHHGVDPISGMALAPQPRLDIDLGNAVQLAEHWDLTIDLSIIDRGELARPETRLPVIDGGFDQIQIMVGISRRVPSKNHGWQRGISDPLIQL